MNVLSDFSKVKHFVLDVDGVLTTGQLLLLESGEMARSMNIKDGYAMQLAVKKNYSFHIITGASSIGVINRIQKLGIRNIYSGVADKATRLQKIIKKNQFDPLQILYMGDDIPDMEAMQICGLPCCPADAVTEIKQVSKYISPINGGMGCVRDVIEKVLRLNGDWSFDSSAKSM